MSDSIDDRTCQESRYTVDHLIKRIENQDRKAIHIFRLNLLLIGILLTSLTILLTMGVIIDPFLNLWSLAGVISLLGSTFIAAVTYTSSGYDIGISPQIIENVEREEYTDVQDFDSELIGLYKEWIRHNRSVGDFNVYLVMVSILSAFNGIVFVLGGAMIGVLDYGGTFVSYILFLSLIVILLVVDAVIWTADELYVRFGGNR